MSPVTHRYAETQLASNPGARYRDWVCLAYTRETMGVENAKLEAHIIDNITAVYESPLLLPFGEGKRCQLFVRASTSEGLQYAVTHLATRATLPDSSYNGFARTVRALVLSPEFTSRLQPLALERDEATDAKRRNAAPGTVYCDAAAKQVLFVYNGSASPNNHSTGRLEFIQFCLM